jgi:PDZ domain
MGFFKNIFRRKGSADGSPTSASAAASSLASGAPPPPPQTSTNRRGRRAAAANRKLTEKGKSGSSSREDSPTQLLNDDVVPAMTTTTTQQHANSGSGIVFASVVTPNSSNSTIPSNTSGRLSATRGPDLSDGTQRAMLSPRVVLDIKNTLNDSQQQPVLVLPPKVSSPVDLDDESNGTSYEEKKMENDVVASSKLVAPGSTFEAPARGGPIFAMMDSGSSNAMVQPKLRFSAGNVSVEDDTDGESSSFNLSTDAEDTEYEAMRRRLGAIMPPPPPSQASMDMSVTNYTTDGETSVFPGLLSEDDATMTTASVTKEASSQSILHLPTVNPATGASLVPVDRPYAGTTGFPGVYDNRYAKQSLSSNENAQARFALPDDTRFVQQQISADNTSNRLFNKPLPSKDEMRFSLPDDSRVSKTEEIRFSKPEEQAQQHQPQTGDRKQSPSLFGSFPSALDDLGDEPMDLPRRTTTPSLALPKKDSPERKRSSPKVSKASLLSNNSNFASYNSNFMEAVYGAQATSQHDKTQQPQRRSFTSLSTQSHPFPAATSTSTAAKFEPFANDLQPFDAAAPFASNMSKADEDLFAGFADFSNFDNAFSAQPVPPPQPETGDKGRSQYREQTSRSASFRSAAGTSTSAIHNETSLSELLAQAKSKSSRGGSQPKKMSTSVSSAPAMTASYLRQHHNLGKNRAKNDGTSVTDIIHSLEAAHASRATESSSRSLGGSRHSRTHSRDDGQSAHSRDGAASLPSKDKHRRRRERRHHRTTGDHSSDSEDDYEDNESWLFDEVTGTLGPRGIAADLESLSGRSNRSSSSRGNRSHKSHRSHKSSSRTSRRRHKTGSGDSVDSRHSRDSRRSRGSRYSHRSTRSYISQMSEQSRSVANDLLRLEMQLAMVGSGGPAATAVGGGGTTSGDDRSMGRSRVGRTAVAATATTPSSSSRRPATARRSRITVHAPPGKLGIILANKADSRGTVVSGVRTTSVLAETITPGDRIVAIDGEDVSLMTVSEITTIMARNADFDRTLTVLTTPRHSDTTTTSNGINNIGSPRSSGDKYPQRYYRG